MSALPEPLLLSFSEAARRLGLPESWLRAHVRELPHRRLGRKVMFTVDDLDRIVALAAATPPPPVTGVTSIRPSGRRRSA
jgi:DNA-binding Lrp family transcriptional regulator